MDLHAAQIQGFFNIPVDHLYGKPIIIRELREKFGQDCENLTVVSPDVGGVKMARAYSDALGARLAIVAKHRVSATEVEAMQVIGDVEGRDVVLVDDMTETAGTLCAAADILKNQGAKRIFAEGVARGGWLHRGSVNVKERSDRFSIMNALNGLSENWSNGNWANFTLLSHRCRICRDHLLNHRILDSLMP